MRVEKNEGKGDRSNKQSDISAAVPGPKVPMFGSFASFENYDDGSTNQNQFLNKKVNAIWVSNLENQFKWVSGELKNNICLMG